MFFILKGTLRLKVRDTMDSKEYLLTNSEILESCRHYINCTLNSDGSYTQWNMECPGDLVFANGKLSC